MRPDRPFAAVIAPLAALLLCAATESAAQTTYDRSSAPAQAVGSASVVLKPNQLDFDFGGGKATLSPKGEWTIEASVTHRGLLCGEYSVGLRFGIGRPGCSNVAWLTDVSYATAQRQCNNARLYHSGGDVQPELAASFAQISCAERVIRCTGVCK
ncbi:MAG: hypothetical protein AMJ66_04675 [Betaproteobacteria bacterium SG8_40]|nr:MAG: hypothetical protein AMJ66_04675 [Betaproteobacteria bacterium SG8_40]